MDRAANFSDYSSAEYGTSYEDDYDGSEWFPDDGVPTQGPDGLSALLKLFEDPRVMGNLETLLHESYKFIRMADDLHDIRNYLNDMRICFIALTVSGYVGMLIYALVLCLRRNRKRNRRSSGYNQPQQYDPERAQWDGDANMSVRSDPGYRFQPAMGPRVTRLSRMETMEHKNPMRDGFKESLVTGNDNGHQALVMPALAKDTLAGTEVV